MVMEPQAPGPVTSSSSSSKIVTEPPMTQLPPLDHSSMSMQSSAGAVPSAPPSKVVHPDPATGTTTKPNSHTLGLEFVRQYYTMLNKAPSSVHRFYAEDSSFIHGSLNDSVQSKPVYGHSEINERIMALNFKDCHAKIVRVDSLETVEQGFVIQVTGDLSNNGQPMRRFSQTFVLVPRSPNNYYVRNDIFRYQDEVFADEEEVDEAEETEVTPSAAPLVTSTAPVVARRVNPHVSNAESGELVPVPVTSSVNATPAKQEERKDDTAPVEKAKGPHKVNGFQEQKSPSVAVEAPEQPPQQQQNSKSLPSAATAAPAATTSTGVAAAPSSVPSVPQSEKAPVSSWAAKVARHDATKPPSDVGGALTSGTSNVTATSTLAPSPKASKDQQQNTSPAGHHPNQPSQQQQQHQPGRKGDRGAKAARVDKEDSNALNEGADGTGNENHEVIKKVSPYNDEQQVFVGNLPLDIKEEDLKNFFGKFGNILDVRINRTNQTSGSGRTPNYGFVTFDDAKVVRTILSQKPIYFNEHRFNVEEKRSQGRGSALPRSGSGATLGVNKGANQQQQQQQNSQNSRRERRDRFPFQGNREAGPRRNQTGGGTSGAPGMAGQGRPVFQPKR